MLGFGKKTWTETCSDGTTVRVYKNADDAFQLHLGHRKAEIDATVSAFENIQAGAGGKYESIRTPFLVRVDEVNGSLQQQFRAVYTVFQSSPCYYRDYLKNRVDTLIANDMNLRPVQMALSALKEVANSPDCDGKTRASAVAAIRESLSRPQLLQDTLDEVRTAHKDMKELEGGSN